MIKKFNQVFSAILAACVLFTSVPVNALSAGESNTEQQTLDELNTENIASTEESNATSTEVATDSNAKEDTSISDISSNDIDSSEEKLNNEIPLQNDETEDGEYSEAVQDDPASNDNWELGLVFYDSEINNGQTALESIDWDATDDNYKKGSPRQITMQINYAHYDSLESYAPGDITIKIPNFLKDEVQIVNLKPGASTNVGNGECLYWEQEVCANTGNTKNYDWNCEFKRDNGKISEYIFTNDIPFEEIVNFEGSIQIVYTLTPKDENPEKFENECIHNTSKNLKANLNIINHENYIESNELAFNYTRTYIHPWEYKTYEIKKGAEILKTYDGLPENASNYIWVKYTFKDNGYLRSSYPLIGINQCEKRDVIPTECKVYNKDMELLTPTSNNTYIFNDDFLYIAYPKEIYNKENNNLIFTNQVELWGTYEDKTQKELLAQSNVTINLSEFEINYTGDVLSVEKEFEDVVGWVGGSIKENMTWRINVKAIYTGTPLTIKIEDVGGDARSYSSEYFTNITFPANIKNGNNIPITPNKYDCELWVKTKNGEYTLYDSFKNPSTDKVWELSSSENICNFYFLIKNMHESFIGTIKAESHYRGLSIMGGGGDVDNTANIQSGIDKVSVNKKFHYYIPVSLGMPYMAMLEAQKTGTSLTKINNENAYKGQYTLGSVFYSNYPIIANPYYQTLSRERAIKGFKMYDLLPKGVEITSTKEEIINSLKITDKYGYNHGPIYIANNNDCTSTSFPTGYKELEKNTETVINIDENWKNTGRTRIEIIGTFKKPIFVGNPNFEDTYTQYASFRYDINYKISIDDLLENKKILNNYVYVENVENSSYLNITNRYSDNGVDDKDAVDINNNNQTTDYLSRALYSTSLQSAISTHQNIAKYVKTNKQYYSIGTVESDLSSEYTYKLRVMTGKNDVTNLILYDSIEENAWDKDGNIIPAYENNKHWNGEFLGVDISYAKENGQNVKVYYSENKEAGNLYNDDGSLNTDWTEYISDETYTYEYGEPQTINSPNWPNNYNNNMSEDKNYWEISKPGAEFLEITFDSTCKLESANYDYLRFYDKDGNNITKTICNISSDKIGGTNLAGKTYTIPGDYVKITMRTDSSGQYKGFSADIVSKTIKETISATDNSKVKALAFEYLDNKGNPAIIPKESVTYVEIKMKSPDTEYKTFAYNGCRSEWKVIDPTTNRPVDGITGMHSNIVRVGLPTSVEKEPEFKIQFLKEIIATDEAWDNMQLNKNALYNFQVSMKNRETGDIISVQIDNKNTVTVREAPIGTYTITEKDDMYFDFVSMEALNSVEGITFEKVGNDYVLTITKDAAEEALQIKVNNKIEPDRPYEDKEEKENLFKYKDESIEINTYIVYWYDSNGNVIKTSETRTGAVGTTIHATTDDKNISGYKYDESNSLNIESIILSKNEGNKLKLYFNKL